MKKTGWGLLEKLARDAGKKGRNQFKAGRILAIAALALPFLAGSQTTLAAALDGDVPLHGFADVGYRHASKDLSGGQPVRGFYLGSLDLYFAPQFGDRVKMLAELFFEFEETGELAVEMERLQLGYAVSDRTTVWAGRFHTPFGYWNTAYHHGAQIQTSLMRPKFMEFEDLGGIMPVHTTGLWAIGKFRISQGGTLTYDAYTGNGSRILSDSASGGVLDANNSRDDNGNKTVGLKLSYDFGGSLEGLQLGAHGLKQEVGTYIGASPTPVSRTAVKMIGGYMAYFNHDWEGIAEYYAFNNQDLPTGTGSHQSSAGFAHLGYSFNTELTPYVRLEKADFDQGDSYFSQQASGRSYERQALGVRYNLNPRAAIKFEVNHTNQTDTPPTAGSFDEARAQYAIRF